MNPERWVVLGVGGVGASGVSEALLVWEASGEDSSSSLMVRVDTSTRGDLAFRIGRVDRSKISPDRRIGRVAEYFSSKISRDSLKMGVVEGVYRVRGWMVIQSTFLFCACPMTVSR